MKTFKDISWKAHSIKGAIQGLLMLDSGMEMSIVAGKGLYSLPRDAGDSPDNFLKFEVAIFDEDGNFVMDDGNDVLGWQSRSDIDELIEKWS